MLKYLVLAYTLNTHWKRTYTTQDLYHVIEP